MDRMYSCFEMTDNKEISATLSLRKSESSQDFCGFGAYFEVRTVCPYVFPELTICFPMDDLT